MKTLLLILFAVTTAITVDAQVAPIVIEMPLGNGCVKHPTSIVVNSKEDRIFVSSFVSDLYGPEMTSDALVQKYDAAGNILSEYRYSEISYGVEPVSLVFHDNFVVMVANLTSYFSNEDKITIVVLDTNLNTIGYGYYPFVGIDGRIAVSSKSFVHNNVLHFLATSTSTTMNTNGTQFLGPTKVSLFEFDLITQETSQIEIAEGQVCSGAVADEDGIYAILKSENAMHIVKLDFNGNQVWSSNSIPLGAIRGFGFSNGSLKLATSNNLFNINVSNGEVQLLPEFPFILTVVAGGFALGPIQNGVSAGDKLLCSSMGTPDSALVIADFSDSNPYSMVFLSDAYVDDENIYFIGKFTNFATNPRTESGYLGWLEKESIYIPDPIVEEPTDTTGGENTLTGIGEIEGGTAVTVYPNPSDGEITVRTENDNCSIVVTDMVGKTIFAKKLTTKETKIKLDCARGVYFLRATSAQTKNTVTLLIH